MRRGQSSPLVDYWVGAYRAQFDRLDLRSPREQAGFQDLLNQAATRTTGRQERLSDDTPTVPTPLWVTLVFGGAVAVALNLGMADPREKLYVHGVMMAGIAAVVTAGLLIVYFLDHPYGQHAGGIEPTAMQQALGQMRGLEPALRPACSAARRPL
jgi:hypothetical protein